MTTSQFATEKNDSSKEIIIWACDTLLAKGYDLISYLPENVQITPWSYVIRFSTSQGYVYLKRTPVLLSLEADIIQLLKEGFKVSVPDVIGRNIKLNCFLMKDAGRSLRDVLKQRFDVDLFCRVIKHFTAMQASIKNHVESFINIGVPDWRLNRLPELYKELLTYKDILLADGLTENVIGDLEKLYSKVGSLCQKLSAFNIQESVVQPDFNDNNTLLADSLKKITIIDLGEISISHPFFSLINCLIQVKKHHKITETDALYIKMQDACFENFKSDSSAEALKNALDIASLLFPVYMAKMHGN